MSTTEPPGVRPAPAAPPEASPGGTWLDLAIAAYAVAIVVGLLVGGGAGVLAGAIAPRADAAAIGFGAVLLGLGAAVATLGIILAVRSAVLPRPPAKPAPTGKVEI
jgi:hypothetical protein